MSWVDIAILVIILLNALQGLYRGFIISVFNLLGFLVAGYVAKLYYPVLSKYILNNPDIFSKIKDFVVERVNVIIEGIKNPQDVGSILEAFKLPEAFKEGVVNSPQLQTEAGDLVHRTGTLISEAMTHMFIDIISIIIIFVAARIILRIIAGILDNIARLPVLTQFNKLSGLIFGLIQGVLVIYLIYAILTPFITIYPDGMIATGTFNSILGYYFYSNNLIIKYLYLFGILV